MNKEPLTEDKNINRRNFFKKITMSAVFMVPTIQTFKLLDDNRSPWWWWTGHHHHHGHGHGPTPPPPPPPQGSDDWGNP
ncbi:MAG: hypothetical protein J7L86_05510 [Candidatus Marinimicrobia bacterium]|nr:hypothetical protein [Candidatus Neomarinimicrobiota bacterium]